MSDDEGMKKPLNGANIHQRETIRQFVLLRRIFGPVRPMKPRLHSPEGGVGAPHRGATNQALWRGDRL